MAAGTTTESSRPVTGQRTDRPRFAIGHVGLSAADVERLAGFYIGIGMRPVVTTA